MRKTVQRFQPTGAWADVRYFLGHRQPHQFGFAALSITIVLVTIWAFWHDSRFEKPYKRDIVYVQQWRLDRTDAEIIAQQKIDGIEQTRRVGEEERRQAENRRKFQRIKDKMDGWGL